MKSLNLFKTAFFTGCIAVAAIIPTACNNHKAGDGTVVSSADSTTMVDSSKTITAVSKDTVSPPPVVADTTTKSAAPSHRPLTLIIKNMATPEGPIVVGVYNAKNKFLDESDELKKYTLSPKGNNGVLTISDLSYGEYGLALFQDVNSDGKINKNAIGIPTEPYAFSNNYKPKIKAPNFKDCKFDYSASADTLTIKMIR